MAFFEKTRKGRCQFDQHRNYIKGHIGTVSEATLELFQRPHWNCFRGSSGTVSEATLELFQRPHWNCFRGSSGTVSGSRLKLFQRQHWNSFKDNTWETSLMHRGAHACRLDLSCVFHCSEGQHSVPRGAAGATLRPSLADLHRGFREGPGRTAGEEQEGRSFQRDAVGAQASGPVRCRRRNGCNKHTCL